MTLPLQNPGSAPAPRFFLKSLTNTKSYKICPQQTITQDLFFGPKPTNPRPIVCRGPVKVTIAPTNSYIHVIYRGYSTTGVIPPPVKTNTKISIRWLNSPAQRVVYSLAQYPYASRSSNTTETYRFRISMNFFVQQGQFYATCRDVVCQRTAKEN